MNQYDLNGWLPLHQTVFHGFSADIIEATIPSGINVNISTLNDVKSTALMLAAQKNLYHICELLLSLGGDPNICGTLGTTALHIAIEYNSHRTMELLLQLTDIHLKTRAGETFLHYTAQYSDITSLKVLYVLGLRSNNLEHRVTGSSPKHIPMNVVGLTALQIAERRTDVTTKWLAMFRKLLHKIEFPNDPFHADSVEVEAEEFHDALESQQA